MIIMVNILYLLVLRNKIIKGERKGSLKCGIELNNIEDSVKN